MSRPPLRIFCVFIFLALATAQFSGDYSGGDFLAEDETVINIVGLFPYTVDFTEIFEEYFGPGVIFQTAVELALDEIRLKQNQSSFLEGYRLNLIPVNSACDIVHTSYFLTKDAYLPFNPVIVLGPKCNNPTKLMVNMLNPDNSLISMSYAARTISLTDPSTYSRFFRTVSPHSELNKALSSLLLKFNWNIICVLVQGENEVAELADNFLQYIREENLNISTIHVVSERNPEFLIGSYCRVFVVFAESAIHPLVSCLMHQSGLTGENFQTIFVGHFLEYFDWQNFDEDVGCYTSLNESAPSTMYINFRNKWGIASYGNESNTTDHDSTAGETIDHTKIFEDKIYSRIAHIFGGSENIPPFDYIAAASAYDATWAIAYALNLSMASLVKRDLTLDYVLPLFSSGISEIVVEQFENLHFEGIYKTIDFSSDRHHPYEDIMVYQYQYNSYLPVAMYNSRYGDSIIDLENSSSYKWLGSHGPPSDKPLELIAGDTSQVSLILASVTLLGLLLCLVFFIFNCAYRKRKVIKASSPLINNIIISGCAMIFVSVLTFSFGYSYSVPVVMRDAVCNSTLWLIFCGFTLSFGSLTVKTWRVYRVHQNPWSKRRLYKDSFLYLLIVVLLAIDLIVLTPMVAISPLKSEEVSEYTTSYTYISLTCSEQQYSGIFTNIMIIYKVLLIIVAGFLSLQTRKIKSKVFNDSKWIAIAIYMIAITCLFGLPLSIISIFSMQFTLTFISIIVLISLQGYIILLTVFVPKIFLLWQAKKDPSTIATPGTATVRKESVYRPPQFESSGNSTTTTNVTRRASDYYGKRNSRGSIAEGGAPTRRISDYYGTRAGKRNTIAGTSTGGADNRAAPTHRISDLYGIKAAAGNIPGTDTAAKLERFSEVNDSN